ncbi:MAG: BTAD domain-containing putative transcriptional regulator [bacterium]
MQSQTGLEIITLGDFQVRCGGKILTHDANRAYRLWELFKYLLTNREQGVLPEVLVETLWPEQEYADPKSAVRTLIYRLRQILDGGCGEKKSDYIYFEQGCYRWNTEASYYLDAQGFEELCQQAQGLVREKPEEAITLLQRAMSLYKGEYLPETAFSEWVLPPRNYYRRLYLQGVVTLAGLLKNARRYEEIISLCEEAIRIEPFEEDLHLPFLEALLAKGRKKQALTHYQYITAALYRELGVKPSQALRHIYRLIQAEDSVAAAQDLSLVQEGLQGASEEKEGAFYCEPPIFRSIYKLESRRAERRGQEVALCLLTLNGEKGAISPPELQEAMEHLQAVLLACLRKGDVVTRWNESQFLVLLDTVNLHQAQKVLKRIESSFWGTWGQNEGRLSLNSKIQPVLPVPPSAQ